MVESQLSTNDECTRESTVSLLRATLEATADGLLVVDLRGRVTTFNERFVTLWRIPDELVTRKSDALLIDYVLNQLIAPEEFLARVRELYAKPSRESFDVVRFKDGRVFERYSRPQRVGATIVGRVWSFRDVTDRELLVSRLSFLADASRLLGSLDVEQALEGLAHCAVPYLGTACAIDLVEDGRSRRLLTYSHGGDEIPVGPHSAFPASRPMVYSVNGTTRLAVPMMLKDELLGVATFAALPGREYKPEDVDVAEEVGRRAALAIDNARLLREVREAVKAREEFLSISAHEIRGPLTSIHLAVQTLSEPDVTIEMRERLLALVAREDRRLARFVEELLDLGRIRSGTLAFQIAPVNLSEVVREVVGRLSNELQRSGSTLSIAPGEDVHGCWDRGRIDQVIANLLGNAIKFGQGKPIDVSVTEKNGCAVLAVEDRGAGVPEAQRETIFEAFERGVSVKHYGGLGLGLFIVRSIVSGLSGTVRVESRLGGGSRFVVELPRGTEA